VHDFPAWLDGRKSDVLDCQWLQQLMSFGLLRGAFRSAELVCVLRSLSRQRAMLLRSQGRFVQHMQKALAQMNIQLANVISDVAGETGQKILRAIAAGERDGLALARLIYAMLTEGEEYTDRGQDYFEERYRQRVLHNLAQKAKSMGMHLVPSAPGGESHGMRA